MTICSDYARRSIANKKIEENLWGKVKWSDPNRSTNPPSPTFR